MNETNLESGSMQERRARLVFVLLSTAGLLGFVSLPWLQRKLGIFDFGRWFLDSLAVLAASDAVMAGIDVEKSNPLDVFSRPHSYSNWWFALGRLGLGRDDNFVVGGVWVLAFLLVVWASLRPRNYREALWSTLLVLSPPVLLAVIRANNDLVVFTLLGAAGLVMRHPGTWRWICALVLIAAATGLKFYPVVAASVFIVLRPRRQLLLAMAASTAILAVVIYDVAGTAGRGMFALPQALYTFGAPVVFRDLGWTGGGAGLTAAIIIALASGFLVTRGVTCGLADDNRSLGNRALFVLGAILLVACFIAGTSYIYRCIFALWLMPWLWNEAGDAGLPDSRRKIARVAAWLVTTVMWADGVFCFVSNILVGPMAESPRETAQLTWRLFTQPFAWVLVALVGGWLIGATTAAVREIRGPSASRV